MKRGLDNKNDWYSKNIEEPLQELVRHLRNNGVNTECSCGHDLYIQCQYILDYDIKELYDLIYSWLSEHNAEISFKIAIEVTVVKGTFHTALEIRLNPDFGSFNKILIQEQIKYHEKMLKYFKDRLDLEAK